MSDKPKFIASPHHSDRNGQPIKGIVIHRIAEETAGGPGSIDGCISWFQNPESKVSAHYLVDQGGSIIQMVRDSEAAWHCGYKTGDYPYWLEEVNPNWVTIGIECEDNTSEDIDFWTKDQLDTLLTLCKILVEEYNIPIDRKHILGHSDIDGVRKPNCPGSHFPWNKFMTNLKDAVEVGEELPAEEEMTKFLEVDIPTEVEEKFHLHDKDWYDDHWTLGDFMSNTLEKIKTVGLPKSEGDTDKVARLREERDNLKEQVVSLEQNIRDIRAGYEDELSTHQDKALELANKLNDTRDKNEELKAKLDRVKEEAEKAFTVKRRMDDTMQTIERLEKALSELLGEAEGAFRKKVEGEELSDESKMFLLSWAESLFKFIRRKRA